MTINNMQLYDDKFYSDHLVWQKDYETISNWISDNISGHVFGDIGCGNGYIIRNLSKLGKIVWGIDGSESFIKYIDNAIIEFVERVDLTSKIELKKADVAICFEVAEHIPEEFSDVLIENIVNTKAKTILFSAAEPGQEGTGHINLQKHNFWISKFGKFGYVLNQLKTDKFREDIKSKLEFTPWYGDNVLIFERMIESGPLVSVVIPCYNMGHFIGDAIDSALNQTHQNIEVIIVNDGSTDDNTIAKLNEIRNHKIKIINQQNKGLPAARNVGIAFAEGEFIVPLDADDKIEATYVEKAVEILKNSNDVGFVTPYIRFFGEHNSVLPTYELRLERAFLENVTAVSSIFRKKCWEEVGGFDEKMTHGYEDWDFWVSIAEYGFKNVILSEPLFYYRRRTNSMITSSDNRRSEILTYFLNKHKKTFNDYAIYHYIEKDKDFFEKYRQLNDKCKEIGELNNHIMNLEARLRRIEGAPMYSILKRIYKYISTFGLFRQ